MQLEHTTEKTCRKLGLIMVMRTLLSTAVTSNSNSINTSTLFHPEAAVFL